MYVCLCFCPAVPHPPPISIDNEVRDRGLIAPDMASAFSCVRDLRAQRARLLRRQADRVYWTRADKIAVAFASARLMLYSTPPMMPCGAADVPNPLVFASGPPCILVNESARRCGRRPLYLRDRLVLPPCG
ncbi:hypothetical protein MRX96_056111 [Rhipicephalus microplus]